MLRESLFYYTGSDAWYSYHQYIKPPSHALISQYTLYKVIKPKMIQGKYESLGKDNNLYGKRGCTHSM